MYDAFSMCSFKCAADLLNYSNRFPSGELAVMTKHATEVFSLHELHGDELRAFSFTQVENSHYVLVSYVSR